MNRLRKISNNCKQATFLIEKKLVSKLTIREKFELAIHLAGCSLCRMFQRQSMVINRLSHQLFNNAQQDEKKLDEFFKKELQDKIDKELKK